MRRSSLLYLTKEIRKRKNAIFSVYIVVTVTAFVLFCFSMVSYSSYIAQVNSLYHANIYNLSYAETEEIKKSAIVKDTEFYLSSNGKYTARIEFNNGDPLLIDQQCQKLINGMNYSSNATHQDSPYWSVNDTYYNLTITPYVIENIRAMFILYLLTGILICLTLNIRNQKTLTEYGFMRALGYSKKDIVRIAVVQTLLIDAASILSALVVAIPVHRVLCLLIEKAYGNYYIGLTFSISFVEMILIICLILCVTVLFQIINIQHHLKSDVTDLIHGIKTMYISFVEKSSGQIEKEDRIGAYTRLYYRRQVRSVVRDMLKSLILFALPTFLLVMSVSFNESRAYDDPRDFVLSPLGNLITDSIVDDVKKIPSVLYVDTKENQKDNSYLLINIISQEQMQENCLLEVEEIAQKYSLALSDIYHQKRVLDFQANIFAPYYLSQAIIVFACSLLIIDAGLIYELTERKKEFFVMRAIGITNKEITRIVGPYQVFGTTGYWMSVLATILGMGFVFHIWITKLLLYPFVIVLAFGIMCFALYHMRCKLFMESIAEEEVSLMLSED